jgi:hypothetical protein
VHVDYAKFIRVASEGVGMWLSIDIQASPSVLDDADVSTMDVRVLVYKVVGENGGKNLGWGDGVLFGGDVGSLLLGVCGYYDAVVSPCVATDAKWSAVLDKSSSE